MSVDSILNLLNELNKSKLCSHFTNEVNKSSNGHTRV